MMRLLNVRGCVIALISWVAIGSMVHADHHLGDEDVATAIKAVNQKLMDCTNSGDKDCAAMQYTSNAVYMAPNAEPLKGRGAIKAKMGDDGTTLQLLSLIHI